MTAFDSLLIVSTSVDYWKTMKTYLNCIFPIVVVGRKYMSFVMESLECLWLVSMAGLGQWITWASRDIVRVSGIRSNIDSVSGHTNIWKNTFDGYIPS